MALTKRQLEQLWIRAGGSRAAAGTAAAIALAESGGRVNALNPRAPDYSVGPWQINYYGSLGPARTRQFGSAQRLMSDPLANARAAVAISSGGRNFSPWTTYTSGAYKRYAGGGGAVSGGGGGGSVQRAPVRQYAASAPPRMVLPAGPSPQQQVAQILAAQLGPLDYGETRAVAEQKAEQARLATTTRAVIAALQAGVKPVRATYDNALAQQQALAKNAAALLAGANPNAATQADLAAVDAPAEQRSQQAAQANAQFGGQSGVLYTQQGSIPGASLLATRQADIAHLAAMPTLASLQSGESLRGLQATAKKQRDQYLASRLSVTGQAPNLLRQLQQQQLDNAYRQQQLQAQFAITPYQAAQLNMESQRLAQSSSGGSSGAMPKILGSSGSGYYTYDPNTGKLHRLLGPAGSKKAGGPASMTPTQTRAARAKGNQLVAHVREINGYARAGKTYTSGPNKGEPVERVTYDKAVEQALQMNIPLYIAVPMLNKVFPVQYEVTSRGLRQIGIRGYPSTFKGGGGRRKKKQPAKRPQMKKQPAKPADRIGVNELRAAGYGG